MNNLEKDKYFLFFGINKIKFVALNQKNEIIFDKVILIDESKLDKNFKALENFLDKNVIEIEKILKSYIKDITLIIDDNNFLTIDISSINNFKNYFNQNNNNLNSLIDLKNNLKKYMIGYEIAHMIINKFIVGEQEYSSMPKELNHQNIFLEIRFICLKIENYQRLKKKFSKYQINIKNILSYKYINSFKNSAQDNIFDIAERLMNGLNQNEILLINKSSKNKGFFEKFFNFFK